MEIPVCRRSLQIRTDPLNSKDRFLPESPMTIPKRAAPIWPPADHVSLESGDSDLRPGGEAVLHAGFVDGSLKLEKNQETRNQ
jgi:hypothetical protein